MSVLTAAEVQSNRGVIMKDYIQFTAALMLMAVGAGTLETAGSSMMLGTLLLYGGTLWLCYATVLLARRGS